MQCNFDTHEFLKQRIYSEGGCGSGGAAVLNSGGNAPIAPNSIPRSLPQRGFQTTNIYFDSLYCDDPNTFLNGEISWDIKKLNLNNTISNCVMIKLMPFYFPNIYTGQTGDPSFFYYRRMFLQFVNAPISQAIRTINDSFHFELAGSSTTGQAILFEPLRPNFVFTNPVSNITEFRARFMVPPHPAPNAAPKLQRVLIPPTVIDVEVIAGTNPAQFRLTGMTAANYTTEIFARAPPAPLSPGVAVFGEGMASGDAGFDDSYNYQHGNYVTEILSATTFVIGALDASGVAVNTPAKLSIPKNRIAFHVQFISIEDKTTNRIDVFQT